MRDRFRTAVLAGTRPNRAVGTHLYRLARSTDPGRGRRPVVPAQGRTVASRSRTTCASRQPRPPSDSPVVRSTVIGPPRLLDVATTDISLALLLGHQLQAFVRGGLPGLRRSGPGPFAPGLRGPGVTHHVAARDPSRRRHDRDLPPPCEPRPPIPTPPPRHRPHPQSETRPYGGWRPVWPGYPRWSTPSTACTLTDDPLDQAVRRLLPERVAATCSEAELVQNPEDLADAPASAGADREARTPRQRDRPGRFEPSRIEAGRVAGAPGVGGCGGWRTSSVGWVGRLGVGEGIP